MDELIKMVCQALKEEAEAVISYCEKIESTSDIDNSADTARVFEKIRLDEVEHIQNLTLQLTNLVVPEMEKVPDGEEV
jgi:hypothetical protein